MTHVPASPRTGPTGSSMPAPRAGASSSTFLPRTPSMPTISGTVKTRAERGLPGVLLNFSNGGGTVTTGPNGYYVAGCAGRLVGDGHALQGRQHLYSRGPKLRECHRQHWGRGLHGNTPQRSRIRVSRPVSRAARKTYRTFSRAADQPAPRATESSTGSIGGTEAFPAGRPRPAPRTRGRLPAHTR